MFSLGKRVDATFLDSDGRLVCAPMLVPRRTSSSYFSAFQPHVAGSNAILE